MDHHHQSEGILKTTPIIRDFELNPCCDHGPTILFERGGQRYFSCSAYRCRKLCPFYMEEERWTKVSKGASGSESGPESNQKALKKRDIKVNNSPLSNPTQRDKGEAQYHFNEKTVAFFMAQFRHLEIDSVLCVGTPSLHQEIRKSGDGKLKSFLLDIDNRFTKLYKEDFSLYNMCNHYFFQDSKKYQEFLGSSKRLALVVDPPFGVKVELIYKGCVTGTRKDFGEVEGDDNLEVFWIFPYFMEGHILSKCLNSNLRMSDFHVEYRNHTKYSGGSKSSKASPIRIFTTVQLSNLPLPEEDYRYCDICTKWVDNQNLHCDLCETCPTKDGGRTYIHCERCQKCVKPTWKHCSKCKICHLDDPNSCKGDHSSSNLSQSRTLYKPGSRKMKSSGNDNSSHLKRIDPVSVNIRKNDSANVNTNTKKRMKKRNRERK